MTFAGLDDKVRGRKQEVNIQPPHDKKVHLSRCGRFPLILCNSRQGDK